MDRRVVNFILLFLFIWRHLNTIAHGNDLLDGYAVIAHRGESRIHYYCARGATATLPEYQPLAYDIPDQVPFAERGRLWTFDGNIRAIDAIANQNLRIICLDGADLNNPYLHRHLTTPGLIPDLMERYGWTHEQAVTHVRDRRGMYLEELKHAFDRGYERLILTNQPRGVPRSATLLTIRPTRNYFFHLRTDPPVAQLQRCTGTPLTSPKGIKVVESQAVPGSKQIQRTLFDSLARIDQPTSPSGSERLHIRFGDSVQDHVNFDSSSQRVSYRSGQTLGRSPFAVGPETGSYRSATSVRMSGKAAPLSSPAMVDEATDIFLFGRSLSQPEGSTALTRTGASGTNLPPQNNWLSSYLDREARRLALRDSVNRSSVAQRLPTRSLAVQERYARYSESATNRNPYVRGGRLVRGTIVGIGTQLALSEGLKAAADIDDDKANLVVMPWAEGAGIAAIGGVTTTGVGAGVLATSAIAGFGGFAVILDVTGRSANHYSTKCAYDHHNLAVGGVLTARLMRRNAHLYEAGEISRSEMIRRNDALADSARQEGSIIVAEAQFIGDRFSNIFTGAWGTICDSVAYWTGSQERWKSPKSRTPLRLTSTDGNRYQ